GSCVSRGGILPRFWSDIDVLQQSEFMSHAINRACQSLAQRILLAIKVPRQLFPAATEQPTIQYVPVRDLQSTANDRHEIRTFGQISRGQSRVGHVSQLRMITDSSDVSSDSRFT